MATDITLSGATTSMTLNSQLNGGYIDFTGGNETITIEPSALVGSTSSPTDTLINGEIYNFASSDKVVLVDLVQQLSIIGFGGIAADIPYLFLGKTNPDLVLTPGPATGATVQGIPIYGSLSSNNGAFGFVASTGGTLYNSIIASLELIQEKSFGSIVTDGNANGPTFTLDFTQTTSNGATITLATVSTSQELNINPNPCFVTGTRIVTTRGAVAVEALAVGDRVVTASGGQRPITWIGHRDLDLSNHVNPEMARPIRVTAGALGYHVPVRDLVVSPDHAFWIDGVLVQAKDLVDGALIKPDLSMRQLTYWHVELDAHDVLLAEGAPAESYLDTGHRGYFDNGETSVTLHPAVMQERRVASSCAPLVIDGPQLAAIRAALATHREALGYVRVDVTPTLLVNDDMLVPSLIEPGLVEFVLPGDVSVMRLLTGVFQPSQFDPHAEDQRNLGLSIAEISLDGVVFEIDGVIDAAYRHPRAPGDIAVWTKGDAMLRLPQAGAKLAIRYTACPMVWQRNAVFIERQVAQAA